MKTNGRYISGCTMYAKPGRIFRNMQEYPCKDAFHSCNGKCKHFAVLLKNGNLVKGKEADFLIERFTSKKKEF